ncbi:GNAT family N-acetyltransferase [Deinococcus detaillensis]|uniref:GNAT family N-acetyltransferase n=2 Tax=Deinococcus detaillensis TaxID=2592048 RepID=A0A553V6R8_9DEIO|nr:GNAT family N-acetyltransferase [Deinococcus detaillensis]
MSEDAPDLARVHVESWAETYQGLMPEDFLKGMTSTARQQRRQTLWQKTLEVGQESVFAAEKDGRLAGFISGGPSNFGDYDAELFTLYLLNSAHGEGVGRALMQTLAADLAAWGHTSLMLWVLDINPARTFYEHLGGVFIGEKTEAVIGGELREVAYGWADLRALL